jgi:hypothetical protein
MKKYPSIVQFRNVIRAVREAHDYQGRDGENKPIFEHKENYPVLKFRGTIKLHGTNAGIVKTSDGKIVFQSRERELSTHQDNAGFMNTMTEKDLNFLFNRFDFNDSIAIYGEWCGGSIQKGVAINSLPKMFVIFGVMIDDAWIDLPADLHNNEDSIYNILQFPTYEIEIDFNAPELSQNRLIEMTIEVEDCCPVGKYFGIEGVGEGIVFSCIDNPEFTFKSKGEKHSASKVKKLNAVDTEKLSSINDFIELAVSENRLEQGISYFNENNIEVDSKNTGEFLRWIVNDVLKEEKDTIESSNLSEKDIKGAIVAKARVWFLNRI